MEEETKVQTMVFAGIGSRFVGSIVDGILLAIVNAILQTLLVGGVHGATYSLVALLPIVLQAAYFTYFHSTGGQTPGMMLLKIKVVTTSGQKLTAQTALIRYAVSIVSGLILMIGYIVAFFNRERQTWHDMAAGTYVVKTD